MPPKEVLDLINLSSQVKKNILNKTIIDSRTDCWLYEGSLSQGYARIYHENRLEFLHRLVAKAKLNYDMNSNLLVLHRLECSNRNCWNFDHLYVGTHQDNTLDSIAVGTFSRHETLKIHCLHGHEFTPENTRYQGNKRKCRECARLSKSGGRERTKSVYSSTKIREQD